MEKKQSLRSAPLDCASLVEASLDEARDKREKRDGQDDRVESLSSKQRTFVIQTENKQKEKFH